MVSVLVSNSRLSIAKLVTEFSIQQTCVSRPDAKNISQVAAFGAHMPPGAKSGSRRWLSPAVRLDAVAFRAVWWHSRRRHILQCIIPAIMQTGRNSKPLQTETQVPTHSRKSIPSDRQLLRVRCCTSSRHRGPHQPNGPGADTILQDGGATSECRSPPPDSQYNDGHI